MIPGPVFGKECQPDCKASRNERCQRIDSIMKCVCRPGFARMFPDRPCKRKYVSNNRQKNSWIISRQIIENYIITNSI